MADWAKWASELTVMDKKSLTRYLVVFGLGVLLAFLLGAGSRTGRYIPFGSPSLRILDTRTGRVYDVVQGKWELEIRRVGR